MSLLTEDIKNLSPPQKAGLYYLQRGDEELNDYMISNNMLFRGIIRRVKAYAEGKIQITQPGKSFSSWKAVEMVYTAIKHRICRCWD